MKRLSPLVEYAHGLQNLAVPPRLSINEAASLFEVWMQDKALHSGKLWLSSVLKISAFTSLTSLVSDDELFMAKFNEASGNPRDFVWKGLLSTLTS